MSVAATAALGATGCTTVAPADTAPIEEQVQIQYSQVEVGLDLDEVVALNPYITGEAPALDAFDAARRDLVSAAGLLVDYSIAVIDTLQTQKDAEAVATLLPLVRGLHADIRALPTIRPFLADVDMTAAIADAADEKNYTRALRALGPANTQISDALRRAVDEALRLYELAYDETFAKIQAETAPFMTYVDLLVVRRNDQLRKLTLAEYARLGDEDAWNTLLEDDAIAAAVGRNKALNLTAIKKAEAVLREDVLAMSEIYAAIEPTWDAYKETLVELNVVDTAIRQNLNAASGIIRDWENAQQRLAKGQPGAFITVTKELGAAAWRRLAKK